MDQKQLSARLRDLAARIRETADDLPEAKRAPLLDECDQLRRILDESAFVANPRCKAHTLFRGLDHLAIAVPDTEEALKVWRDRFDLEVLYREVVNDGVVRLTHLELGNTHLQLAQPLTPDHPLQSWIAKNGPGLHHFCLAVDSVAEAMNEAPKFGLPTAPAPHQGTQGKRAVFLDPSATAGVQVELTGG